MIGIIGAMQIETEILVRKIDACVSELISGIRFYSGRLHGTDVVVAQSGVGKVNAAVCAQTMILKYAPVLIINTGVAGALSEMVKPGDIVIATHLVQYDIDNTAFGEAPGLIPGINIIEIPCLVKAVDALYTIAVKNEKYSTKKGIIATGDQFITSKEKNEWIHDAFNALACEQEGASIGQVCYINGIDFCAVRAISDNGSEDAHTVFYELVRTASDNSAGLIDSFIKEYKNQ